MTKIALLQMCSGIDPARNAQTITDAAKAAAGEGARILFTPEMAGLIDRKKARASAHVTPEGDNLVLARLVEAAMHEKIWIALGSIPVALDGGGGPARWVNRSFLISDTGKIIARYDKIHMFDVQLDGGEAWRESSTYQAGDTAVSAQTPAGRLGLAICYDIRFPALFEALGQQGCDMIATPAAFTVPTGQAHWHVLQRARAIEASAYIICAAQIGEHEDGRTTYGHSLVVDPWGEILLDLGGDEPSLGFAEIDLKRVTKTRTQIPSLANRRNIPKSSRQ